MSNSRPLDRRSFLALAGTGALAGCAERADKTSEPATRATSVTGSPEATSTPSPTETETEDRTESSERENHEPLEVGVVYIPFIGDKFGRCTTVAEPSVGRYGDPIPPEIVTKHATQMRNAGVSGVLFNFGEEREDYERFEAYDRAEATHDLELEPFYVVSQALRRERDVDADLEFLREQFLSRNHARTVDDRPVVTFWDVHYMAWGGNEEALAVRNRLEDEYGSPAAFVDYIRKSLTVDGVEPYLIGDVGTNIGANGFPDDYEAINRELDGLTTWTGRLAAGETIPSSEALETVRTNFQRLSAYAVARDLSFVPMVYPGFDDRHNTCWGSDRYVPRSTEFFRDLFELARRHATGDRVTVATFNDWTEGHQIEAGTFRGTEYGTDYLDVVAEFTDTSEVSGE